MLSYYLICIIIIFISSYIGDEIINDSKNGREEASVPILGLYKSTGHIVLYGDSNCLDSNHLEIGIFG